jgi:hypothetical protein
LCSKWDAPDVPFRHVECGGALVGRHVKPKRMGT